MNLDKAQERAQKVTTPKQAAALYNDIEYELAMGDPDAPQEQNGERALSQLEERFPDVRAQARDVDQPPSVSRTASRKIAGGASSSTRPRSRPRSGGTSQPRSGSSSRRGGHTRPSSSPPSPPNSSGGRSSGSGGSSSAGRSSGGRSRSSSGPSFSDLAPGFDATDSALFVIRAILLLGVGYFLLSKRGSSALSTVLGGITTGVQMIVAPVDPFGGNGVAKGSKVPTIKVPGTTSAPASSLASGNNPRGTTILGGGSGSSVGSTARSMAGRLIPVGGAYPTGTATGALGSQVRQSTGPYGGGSTQ